MLNKYFKAKIKSNENNFLKVYHNNETEEETKDNTNTNENDNFRKKYIARKESCLKTIKGGEKTENKSIISNFEKKYSFKRNRKTNEILYDRDYLIEEKEINFDEDFLNLNFENEENFCKNCILCNW